MIPNLLVGASLFMHVWAPGVHTVCGLAITSALWLLSRVIKVNPNIADPKLTLKLEDNASKIVLLETKLADVQKKVDSMSTAIQMRQLR